MTNDLRDTFFLECDDLLVDMDEGLRQLQGDEGDSETINAVFRAVHSIKGGAGAFSLTELVRFSHSFETVMDELRAGRLELDDKLLSVLQFSGDHLADLVHAARDGNDISEALTDERLEALQEFLGEEQEEEEIEFEVMSLDLDLDIGPDETKNFRINFVPDRQFYQLGHDPLNLLRSLSQLGEATVLPDLSRIPDLQALDPMEAYLSWTIELQTTSFEPEIQSVFEFVEGLGTLEIECVSSDPVGDVEIVMPDLDLDLLAPSEIVVEPDASATPSAPETAPVAAAAAEEEAPQLPKTESARLAPASASAQDQTAKRGPSNIRVDLDRVDKLVNVVGELVIHQAMLTQAFQETGLPAGSEMATGLEELNQLSREIQESVMAIRAQQIKPLFQRMFRIVREAGSATGKKVEMVTVGDNTEVDTAVIEKLADPLTHMIRNSVDHGIEKPEVRAAAGKSEMGTITLSAAHRSGRVIITIQDDGAGVNREKVRTVAIKKGLIPADALLSDSDIDNLLFMPGFSTNDEVSKLSGRGVGMDVVKTSIQSLGGRVSINSTPGIGTTISVSLPLTLAVLDGMVVEVAGHTLVIPISNIVETLKLGEEDFQQIGPNDRVVNVRGVFLPVVDLGLRLGFRGPKARDDDQVVVIVETEEGSSAALLLDGIHDQRQVIIKSLEENYGRIEDVAAATVFGDGRVALILDTASLIDARHNEINFSTPLNDIPLAMENSHA